jgi:hypothetical protein
MLALFPSARVRALVRAYNSTYWADQWSVSHPCSTTCVTVVTAYLVQYPPSCRLPLPSVKSSRSALGMAVSVRSGWEEKTLSRISSQGWRGSPSYSGKYVVGLRILTASTLAQGFLPNKA